MEHSSEYELGELLEKIIGGGTPSKRNPDYWGGKTPWASVKDMKDGVFSLSATIDHITEEGLQNSSANLIPAGTVIISTRMGLGRCFINKVDMAINQDLKALVPKEELDNDYLLWLMASKAEEIQALGTGTTVKGIRLEELRALKVKLPELFVQKEIASVLSAYNHLIENNNRRIAILEAIAQNLYREWFINFRFPGHDQSSGQTIGTTEGCPEGASATEGASKQTQWQETPQGKIPLGWEVKRLSEIAAVNPESITKRNAPSEIHYIDISSVNTGSIEEVKTMSFEDAPSRARRVVRHGDIIWATVRPNRKQFSYIAKPIENTIASTGFAVLRAEKIPASFLYQATTTDSFTAYLVNHATGAAYPAVNSSVFESAEILVPDETLLAKFDELVRTTMAQMEVLKRKNNNLRRQRDMLLPKLIS